MIHYCFNEVSHITVLMKFHIETRSATFFIVLGLLAIPLLVTMSIQSVSARSLPTQAGEDTKQTNTDCGGGTEVGSAFPLFGTDTGKLTGELNSGATDHQGLNLGWAAIAGSCGNAP